MSRLTISINQVSLARALNNLAALPVNLQNRHVRIALNAAGGVIKRFAISNAPADTGMLKKSIIVKVKVPRASRNVRHHGTPPYAVIGPRKNLVAPYVGGKRLSIRKATRHVLSGGKVLTRKPSRYAHLVERGTNRGMLPNPFLGKSVQSGGGMALAAMERKLIEGINTEAAKLAAIA